MILPLAIQYWATGLLVGAFLIVCVIMMLVVLIQRPQGGGLSGAFGAGGSGAGQTAFGTKTGDALTYATIGMFLLYLAFADPDHVHDVIDRLLGHGDSRASPDT